MMMAGEKAALRASLCEHHACRRCEFLEIAEGYVGPPPETSTLPKESSRGDPVPPLPTPPLTS